METQSNSEVIDQRLMLPPPPGTFEDRENLIKHARDFGANQGYVVTIKKSRRDRKVILGCDRGGVYRNRRKIEESKRKRKLSSRLINCPFEATGKKEDDVWVLTIQNGEHNHEALRDMSENPFCRRFTEEEVRKIKQMTEAGMKPRQVLKALKKSNPELHSTPRQLYNLKAKIRQDNFTDERFKSLRPSTSSPVATTSAETSETHHCPVSFEVSGKLQMKVRNLIGGRFVESQTCSVIDVVNPATQEVVSQVPLTTYEEFKDAVSAAKQAFPSWKNTPVISRQRIMFKLQELIRRDIDKLVMIIAIEQGQTLNGARGDVLRGLEVVEHACGVATLEMGQFVPNASLGIDTYCIREPIGVCAGICPFNFPALISLWMFPVAVTCGNTFILKPSEKNPGASMILAALAIEAGLPDGVLNIVHGTNDIVNYICDDDDIKAISLISSNTAGIHVYTRAVAQGKRIQSNMGAKNHAIIMPDASADATLDALVSSGFGVAGQRGMTLSTAVFVGGSTPWEEELVERAKALEVNAGTEAGADVGPIISKEEKERICRLVESGVESGARLVLDGRNIVVPKYDRGNFLGPTILCDVTTSMECYKEEMFGPVLLCIQAGSLEEAIIIVNKHKYGNGASIYTTSGVAARKFQNEVEAGLVGINVPVPIPLSFSSFNGSKTSFAGDLSFCAKAGVQFYTQIKTVAQQWQDLPSRRMSFLPPLPTCETETSSRGVSLTQPLTSESDLPSREVSPVMPSTSERDNIPTQNTALTSPPVSIDELPNPSVLLSVPSPFDIENISADQDMSVPTNNSGYDLHGQAIMGPTSERFSVPDMDFRSQRADINMVPSSETVYMPTLSQRTDINMPIISQKKDNMGPDPMDSNSEMLYFMTSHTSDGTNGLIPLKTDATIHPEPERLYMSSMISYGNDMVASHSTDSVPSSSEKLYNCTPEIQRNGEDLYSPAAYAQSPNISMREYRGSQAASSIYPTSQSL